MSIWNSVALGIVSIFLGALAFVFGPIFLLFFVPIVVAIGWDYTARVDRLEKKLAQIEAKLSGAASGASQEHPNAPGSAA
jgi:hypothetical protein